MKITRGTFTDIIFDKANKAIPKKYIYASIKIICEVMVEELIQKNHIYIKNFATFMPILFEGHKITNIRSGQNEFFESKFIVKLRPDATFKAVINK